MNRSTAQRTRKDKSKRYMKTGAEASADRSFLKYPAFAPLVCALIALLVRALYFALAADAPTFLSPGMDAQLYREWAEAIIAGNPPAGPFFRAPLYPYLIAGLGRLLNDTFWPIRILQVLLSGASTAVIFILARRWFSSRAGWAAGLAWAFYGASIYFDGEGLIASLFTSLLVLLLLEIDNTRGRHWTVHTLLTAILFGLMVLLRANALAFAPIIAIAVWLNGAEQARHTKARQLRQPGNLWKRAGVSVLAIGIAVAMLLPVMAYNASQGGGWTISGQSGINLYLGNRPGASGAYAVDPDFGRDWTRAQIELRAEQQMGRELSAAEVSRYYVTLARQFYFDQPGEAANLVMRKALAFANRREFGNNRLPYPYLTHVAPPYAILLVIGFPVLMIFGLAFAGSAWRVQPRIRPALLIALVHSLVVILFFVNARYRFPVAPILALLFGYGIARILTLIGAWRSANPDSIVKGRTVRWLIARLLIASVIVLIPRPVSPIDEDEAWALHQANALLRLGRIDDAQRAFETLVQEHPNARHGHLNLGVIFLEKGNLEAARSSFEAELEVHPGNAFALNNLGVVEERLGNTEAALDAYRRALIVEAALEDARANLVRLLTSTAMRLAETDQFDQAIRYAREAVAARPGSPEPRYNLALLLAASGELVEAENVLIRLIEDNPGFRPAVDALQRLRLSDN